MLRVRKASHTSGCVLAGAPHRQLPSLTARPPHQKQPWHLLWEAFRGTVWVLELWKTRAGVGSVCAGWSGLLQMELWWLQVLV